jgi:protein PhnA
MNTIPPCPECKSVFVYESENLLVCPECAHEWTPTNNNDDELTAIDANGNIIKNGDTVVTIKDLPVKGAPRPIRGGTKVKNIRITNGDHNIDCRIEGYGAMALKSEFVKKVN